jgi:hypothetical protein
MLQVPHYILLSIRADQAKREDKTAARVKVRLRQMNKDRFWLLVDRTAIILRAGEPTRFANEGACRYGLRRALISQAWRWADADATAADVVQTALKQIGAVRPTWDQGQPQHVNLYREERFFCARCGRTIPEDRKQNGTAAKYCSQLCGNAAHQEKARRSGERACLAEWLTRISERSTETLRERSGQCEVCRKPFISRKPGRRFCSRRCSSIGRRLDPKPCGHCETLFKPRNIADLFCSRECANKHRSKPRPDSQCRHCQGIFRPKRPDTATRVAKYCSLGCAANARQEARSTSQCVTVGDP